MLTFSQAQQLTRSQQFFASCASKKLHILILPARDSAQPQPWARIRVSDPAVQAAKLNVNAAVGAEEAVRFIQWNVGHFDQHRNRLSTRGVGPRAVSVGRAAKS